MDLKPAQNEFVRLYGGGGEIRSFHSPGRVNLIGEHTDYNGGYVFPCALSFGTYGIARKRGDSVINFASTNFDLRVSCDLNDMKFNEEHGWANVMKGVIVEFLNRGQRLAGLDLLVSGNIPNGAGLSSSASVELLMGVILNTIFECGVSTVELIKLAQRAENEYIGVKCGIMDQFAVGMGKKGYAILLDCATLKYEYVPVPLSRHKLIIANTNKRRTLSDSKYNERRVQCEKAVEYLNKELNIYLLGDLSVEQFEQYKYLIPDETILKRARHVVYEIDRTVSAVEALKSGNITLFGQLMTESHSSLRDLYEVTGTELDTLVNAAIKVKGTLGSRMTGAGFGGCTVSVVENEYAEELMERVNKEYTEAIGYSPSFYIADTGGGAGIV